MADLRIKPSSQHWKGASHPPRAWQKEALPLALEALSQGISGLIHAVMGSGKSALIAEVCAQVQPASKGVIVISTPTMALVEQLSETIEARIGGRVGRWYGPRQDLAPVIVACNPSLSTLAEALPQHGRRCAVWIVDEAHGSECETLRGAALALGEDVPRLGLTATPFRAKEDERLSLWSELLYSYGPAEARADGVVVPFTVEPWRGGEATMDDACAWMIQEAVEEGWRPLVVDASSIRDAEAFAKRLREEEEVRAEAVHSNMGRGRVKEQLRRLVEGELDVLVHVALLKEGVNIPELRALCLRREVKSPVWMMQHVGRVLRCAPGKDCALILDPGAQLRRVGLHHEAVLGGELFEMGMEVENEGVPEAALDSLDHPYWSSNIDWEGFEGFFKGEGDEDEEEDEEEPPAPRWAVSVPDAAYNVYQHCVHLEAAGLLRRTRPPERALQDESAAHGWKADLHRKIKGAFPRLRPDCVPRSIRDDLRCALTVWSELDAGVATDVFDLVYLCLRPDLQAELDKLGLSLQATAQGGQA